MRRSRLATAVGVLMSVTACSTGGPPVADDRTPSPPPVTPTRTSPDDGPTRGPTPAPTARRTPAPRIEVPELRRPPRTNGLVRGADVSWPQCPEGMGIPVKRSLGLPMPQPAARFVVVGLTNGPGFTRNPCLDDQVRWVQERGLMAAAYAVSSFPDDATLQRYAEEGPYDGSTRLGALANTGYQQALFNVAGMQRAGLVSPVVWVDVEPVAVFEWSADTEANAAVVTGAVQAYDDAGHTVGTYSTPALWEQVVGSLVLGLPEWRAAGRTSRAEALRRCGPDWAFQGGEAVMAQWVEGQRDLDTTCPGVGRELHRWFHQY